jgi:DNA-binding transcriptional LysR family regulator
MPRSTVSRRLVELEHALGGAVVTRSTRRFALTELGVALLSKCTQLEELLDSTRAVTDRAAKEPSGTLSIATSPAIGEEVLPPVIEEFVRRFPRVRLVIDVSAAVVELGRGGADLAVRPGPLPEKSDLYAVRLASSFKGHYASPGYLKRNGTPQTPDELAAHDCILMGDGARPAVWSFRSNSGEAHVTVTGPLRINNQRVAMHLCAAGIGIARLPSTFARPLVTSGELVPVLEKLWPRTELFAVHAAGQPAPPKIRAFIDLLRSQMSR